MGTPEPEYYAASLLDFAGVETAQLVRRNVPSDQKILDIGAGWMKYRMLLNEYAMDAIEVWPPYVDRHRHWLFYDQVYIMEAVHFSYPHRYGAVILGDVLEHMAVRDAQQVIRAACDNSDFVVVAVPFRMPQHEEEGNPYEVHVQEDLNEDLMAQRYPELKLHDSLAKPDEHTKAIYIKA